MRPIVLVAGLATCGVTAGCSSEKEELETCHRKGITYYREISSYPTLSDGQDANKVIGQICANSRIAFGG